MVLTTLDSTVVADSESIAVMIPAEPTELEWKVLRTIGRFLHW